MDKITALDKANCALREVRQRQRVYQRRVEAGTMTREFADRQIAIMQAIADDYRFRADQEDKPGRLF